MDVFADGLCDGDEVLAAHGVFPVVNTGVARRKLRGHPTPGAHGPSPTPPGGLLGYRL